MVLHGRAWCGVSPGKHRAPQIEDSSWCRQAQPSPPACNPCLQSLPIPLPETLQSEPCANSPSTAPAPLCLPLQDAAKPSWAVAMAPASQSSSSPLPLALPGLAVHGEEWRSLGTLPAPSAHPAGTTAMPAPCALAARAHRWGVTASMLLPGQLQHRRRTPTDPRSSPTAQGKSCGRQSEDLQHQPTRPSTPNGA